MQQCFHCGLPADASFSMEINSVEHAFCCAGCQAITCAISESGLSAFYQFRDKKSLKPNELVPAFSHYDLESVQQEIVRPLEEDYSEILVSLSGISCAACAWLIEHHVEKIAGVRKVSVNVTNALCRIEWNTLECKLSTIFSAIDEVGYGVSPYLESRQQNERRAQNKSMLMRLGVAGIGMMQVGMYAIALHAGAVQDMDNDWQHFFRWVSLIVATPVVFYSAQPFFSNALKGIKRRRLGMDVPVALAIGLAYVASIWATILNVGEVYFDSISMFTFFLLSGRYLEMKVRHSSAFAAESFSQLLPLAANRLVDEKGDDVAAQGDKKNGVELVPLSALNTGDKVLVAAGDVIPCDGVVCDGEGSVSEMLLTGEAEPQQKFCSQQVWAGSVVGETALTIRVDAVGSDTKLASIEYLAHRAMSEKPDKVVIADKIAGIFVMCVLLVASAAAVYWYFVEPAKAFWVALSVLVVTCPCALSLATPAALTAGALRLRKMGVLVTSSFFIERLTHLSRVVFDKTGTLTEGKLSVERIEIVDSTVVDSEERVMHLVASLEANSNHPIASAFTSALSRLAVEKRKSFPGQGIEGVIESKTYRFGTTAFASPQIAQCYPGAGLWQLLSCEQKPIAWVLLQDKPRSDVESCLNELSRLNISFEILSGDREENVVRCAQRYGIESYVAGALPEQKLTHIRQLQSQGDSVLMVGDGINDVPGLSGAGISVAMGNSTHLAQTHADAILLSGNLVSIARAINFSHKVYAIIRQNFCWAIGYNLLALPAAVMGLVPPYLAAAGMSLSSLIVVLNALRLNRNIEADLPPVDSGGATSLSMSPSTAS